MMRELNLLVYCGKHFTEHKSFSIYVQFSHSKLIPVILKKYVFGLKLNYGGPFVTLLFRKLFFLNIHVYQLNRFNVPLRK
jgi:hypothetical protein